MTASVLKLHRHHPGRYTDRALGVEILRVADGSHPEWQLIVHHSWVTTVSTKAAAVAEYNRLNGATPA